MSAKWLITNATKIGISTATDSLRPSQVQRREAAHHEDLDGTFSGAYSGGRNEKMASTPDATEIAIVST
jgi:hypothetical protein